MLQLLRWLLPALSVILCMTATIVGAVRFFKEKSTSCQADKADRKELLRVCLCCLIAGLLFQGLSLGIGFYKTGAVEWGEALRSVYGNSIDARHYLNLAQYGYGTGAGFPEQELMIVFFPLYPWLLRLINPFGLNWYIAGTLIQLPLFCWAGTGLYILVRRHFDRSTAVWALTFLLASPAAFFFFAPMTESLFLALTVTFALLLEDRRYILCGMVGLLSGLCRSPGALLTGMALIFLSGRWLHRAERPAWSWFAPILGPVSGLGLYFLLNRLVYGNWFQYAIYQKEHWYQEMGLFPNTVRYLLDYVQTWWADNRTSAIYISLAGVLCILIQLALLAGASGKLPVHQLAYGVAYTIFTCGATWLLSAPRYAVGLFCLPAALAIICRKNWVRAAVLVPLLLCGVLYLRQFYLSGPIY